MMYFRIYDWMLYRLNLRGNELLVYAYLYMWQESKQPIYLRQWQMAELLRMQKTHFSTALKKLRERGLIGYENGNIICYENCNINDEKSYKNGNKKLRKQEQKVTKMVTSSYENGNITINKNKKEKNKRKNFAPEETESKGQTFEPVQEPEQVDAGSKEQRRLEIILQGIADQYAERGEVYVPNYATQTTVALSLVRKVETLMQHYNVADTDDQFTDVWSRFLTAGYESGDQFQREHWTLDYIDKQFMAIFNKLNSENNGKQQGTNRSGKGNARISADYVQKTMREAGLTI